MYKRQTAHRILADEIEPLKSVLEVASAHERQPVTVTGPDIYRDRRGLKIHHSDLSAFSTQLEAAFDTLAERYYVHLKCAPRITVGKDDIRVRFDLEKED